MRGNWKSIGLALLASVVIAGSAAAQQGRGFGGRGGFGAAGGGMMLLRMPEVQSELKLSDEQKTKISEMLTAQRGGRRGGGQFQGLSREELQQRMAERREAQQKQLAEVLNADQLKRYRQLELQQQGMAALARTEVQDELKLTADQKSKIQSALREQAEAMREVRQSAAGDRNAMRSKTAEIRRQTEGKLNGILTEEQKTQWKAMLGAPFTFPTAPARRATDSV